MQLKQKRQFTLFVCSLIALGNLQAQGLPTSTLPQSGSGSSMGTPALPPLTQPKTEQEALPPSKSLPPLIPTAVPQSLNYLHPGVLVYNGSQWEGSDNLLNVGNQIGAYVEILRPNGVLPQVTQESILTIIQDMFARAGFSPALGSSAQPPLPAFQVKIFIYPLGAGYVCYCEARLFESVLPRRINLDAGMAMQAITWQRSTLFLETKDLLPVQLNKQVESLTQTFLDIHRGYQGKKS
jgi:hypothetical protein